jgi:hypothetical protein
MTFVRSANYYTTDPETYIVALIVVFYTRERERERERERVKIQIPRTRYQLGWKSSFKKISLGKVKMVVEV